MSNTAIRVHQTIRTKKFTQAWKPRWWISDSHFNKSYDKEIVRQGSGPTGHESTSAQTMADSFTFREQNSTTHDRETR